MDKKFSIYRNDELCLRLKDFRKKNDSSTDVDIEYDDVFLKTCKSELGTESPSREQLSGYISEIIHKAIMGMDGYRMDVDDAPIIEKTV